MDRTSILGDTIAYMKDLMEKIRSLKEQDTGLDSSSLNELKVNQTQERNSPKVLFFYSNYLNLYKHTHAICSQTNFLKNLL